MVNFQDLVGSAQKVTALVVNQNSMYVMHLVTYVVFGIVLAALALALWKGLAGSPNVAAVGGTVGLIWACMLVASGLVFNSGGLWVLLVSLAALRTAGLPKTLNWLGMLIGIAGVASVIPVLQGTAYVFGLLEIVWFIWVGIVMFRTRPSEGSPRQLIAWTVGRGQLRTP